MGSLLSLLWPHVELPPALSAAVVTHQSNVQFTLSVFGTHEGGQQTMTGKSNQAYSVQKHCGEECTELDGQPGASSMKSSSSSKKHMIYQDHG